MRAAIPVLMLVLAACGGRHIDQYEGDALEGSADPLEAARLYLSDASLRRAAIEQSVSVADTPYGELRLAHYGFAWEDAAETAPRVRPLRADGVASEEGMGPVAPSLASREEILAGEVTLEDWERAGREAFSRYPAGSDLILDPLRDPEEAARAGFPTLADGTIAGLVEVETDSGWVVALTCAACHSRVGADAQLEVVPSDSIRLSRVYGTDWPLGTLDVTGDGIDNPVRPADLRAYALQARQHHAGNVANGRIARMVRIETLLITQRSGRVRPERRVVAALALYLESLATTLPSPREEIPSDDAGAQLFEATCAGCHRGSALSGPPVPLEVIGTDGEATRAGSERSTLGYRAPSLRGVGDRRAILHDGSAADLDALLGLAPSEHIGHPFGRSLSETERRAIASYLRVVESE